MESEVIRPPFKKDSYSERCAKLFDDDQEWLSWQNAPAESNHLWLHRRNMFVEYPHRYWANEIGVNLERDADKPRRILHAMFCVAMMSMDDDENGLRTMHQWFISRTPMETEEHIDYLASTIPRNFQEPQVQDEVHEGMLFALENGFAVPNDEDLFELGFALESMAHYHTPGNEVA